MPPRRAPAPAVTITQKLDALAVLRAEIAAQQAEYAARRALVLAPVAAKLAALEKRHASDVGTATDMQTALETEIKVLTTAYGASVKGERLQAVWQAGRACWVDPALLGYAVVHPEILPCRTQGAPSVQIRAVKP
jgi:hypothetical protein